MFWVCSICFINAFAVFAGVRCVFVCSIRRMFFFGFCDGSSVVVVCFSICLRGSMLSRCRIRLVCFVLLSDVFDLFSCFDLLDCSMALTF